MGLLGKKKEKCDACNKPFEDHDNLVDHQKEFTLQQNLVQNVQV